MFDINMFRGIEGIDLLLDKIPNFAWNVFHDILEFKWYVQYDYEDWCYRRNFEMKMASEDGFNIVLFKFVDVEFIGGFTISGYISGFDIINKTTDYQRAAYEIIDYEDNAIDMLCADFSVKLLQVDGQKIETDC